MRPFVCILLLTAMPMCASAQTETSAKGNGQEFTLERLQGATISGVVNYVGRFRTRFGESTSTIAWNYRLKIGPGSAVNMSATRNVHWQTKDGPKTASLSISRTGAIGVPKQHEDGAALWLLEGNTLVLLRVFEVGGMAMRIALTETGSGLGCSVTAPIAREVGAGQTKMKAAVGGKVEMLSMRQTSSSCRVSKG